MPARGVRIAIYCLGADVEMSISLKPPSGGKRKNGVVKQVKVALDELIPLDWVQNDERAGGLFGGDHAEEKEIKEEDDVSQTDMELMAVTDTDPPKPYFMSRANQIPGGRPLRENEIGKDPLFVTLVHGDMLLFEGDDFEVCPCHGLSACRSLQEQCAQYTLKRTGMSIGAPSI